MGDSCLFHARNGQVLKSFPLDQSAQFDTNPHIVRSVHKRADVAGFEHWRATCQTGDWLVLATDAVAAWAVRLLENEVEPDWPAFWGASQEDWQTWIVQQREANQMRYDDSTVLLLRVGGPPQETPEEDPTLEEDEEGREKLDTFGSDLTSLWWYRHSM